jgi:DNA repair protein RecO (recombination protein O)
MPLVMTQAIVLHAFDYLETSRVLRLITREAGLQSVIAKGARRTRGRIGTGVDIFAEGEAQVYIKPSRDLHTLGAFDVTKSRSSLAMEMARFTAASAFAELVMRVAADEPSPEMFDGIADTLDAIGEATGQDVAERALAGAWRLLADSGFAPSLDECVMCHSPVPPQAPVGFSHPAGGVLCDNCVRRAAVARVLPASARSILRDWQNGTASQPASLSPLETRAHQRLLREFVREHVIADDRPLRAFAAWEADSLADPTTDA